jgi:uncharacterized protein involved in type VI secretion and phage assembly
VTRFAHRHTARSLLFLSGDGPNPWLWFLTRTSDCRIFQDQTVPEIVKKVFEDHGGRQVRVQDLSHLPQVDYCVQYRESDYNFVTRLLEHEGIYWYFEHTDGGHKLVLVDSQSAHDAIARESDAPYIETRPTRARHRLRVRLAFFAARCAGQGRC